MTTFLVWIAFGFVAGILAKWIMPGKEPGGFIVTTLIGIGGAVLGGWLFSLLGEGIDDKISWKGMLAAVIGALVILFIWKKLIAPNISKD